MSLELLLNAAEFIEQQEKQVYKGEEKRSEASELKSGIVVKGSADPLASVPFTPSHATVCPLDRRGSSAPASDDRHSHRRRGHHHGYSPPSTNGGVASPLLSPSSFSLSPPLLTSSSSSPSSSVDSPPLGLVSGAYKGTSASSATSSGGEGVPDPHHPATLSPSPRIQANGFLKPPPNLAPKPLSPSSRDFEDHYGKDEAKKRSGSTPSREVHNKLEKNRRAHLKECFETLRRQLPCMEDKKISNQTILKAAHRYIQNLKRKEREYEHEMERLARQKIAHQQHLSSLKKELQAKWDHIDFSAILPDMASLEQNREKDTKSTTTASEQPDFEEDSRDSSAQSNSLTITSSPELKNGFAPHPVDLGPSSSSSESISYVSCTPRDLYQDPNQPLNLSTNTVDIQKSSVRASQQHVNGEWSLRRNSHYATSPYANEEKFNVSKPVIGRVHSPRGTTIHMTKVSTPSSLGSSHGRNHTSSLSTNTSHISPISVKGSVISQVPQNSVSTTSFNSHTSHIKSGVTISQVPSVTNVVTTFPNLTSAHPTTGNSASHMSPNSVGSGVGHIHTLNSNHSSTSQHHVIHQDSNIQTASTTVSNASNLTHVPTISTGGTTIARVPTTSTVNPSSSSVSVGSQEHTIPIVGGNGIQIPAQLVASGVHLSGGPGTILGQPAIQVITPEGYKLLPAEHTQNGTKPLAITLTHPGLEHLSATGEDGKPAPVMVAVSKNGLSALHLTMPTSGRTLSNSIGTPVPVTSVPLNLTVGGSGTAVKVTQTGSTSILPSYLPLTHANGITQLVQGMSLVGPLVVSQPQRGIMVPASASAGKGVKAQTVSGNGGTSVPLVPAQYANTIAGGLVNSVVVVSASTVVGQNGPTSTASVVTSTAGVQTAKH